MLANDVFEVVVGRERFRMSGLQHDNLQKARVGNAEWFIFGKNTIKMAHIQSITKIGERPTVGLFERLDSGSSNPSGDIFNYPKYVRNERLKEFYNEVRRLAKELPELAKEFFDSEVKTMHAIAKEGGEFSFARFTTNFDKWYGGAK